MVICQEDAVLGVFSNKARLTLLHKTLSNSNNSLYKAELEDEKQSLL